MLSGRRPWLRLLFLWAFSAAVVTPLQAQVGAPASVTSPGFGGHPVNGAPPSVTSLGFGGKFVNGIPPSVTTGTSAYDLNWSIFGNCCDNLFWPAKPLAAEHHHHHKDRASATIGVIEPVYVPYAVPDAAVSDEDSADADSVAVAVPPDAYPPQVPRERSSAPKPNLTSPADASEDAQPSTVLVFKDGHHSNVFNYAIVGDTLFDFEAGRTRKILLADLDLAATQKANDDLGVDFKIPSPTGQ